MAFSPDGTRVATGSDDGSARVFDAATGDEVARCDHDDTVRSVAFSPDGTRVATGSDDGSARVFALSVRWLINRPHYDCRASSTRPPPAQDRHVCERSPHSGTLRPTHVTL